MIGSFTEVKPLHYWVQHILPLVYDDSLSYMELLGKVTKILNEMVENNNLLPDYIMQLIKEYISSGEIEKVLSEVLANYMLNVKFPPKGLTPAVGDGSADDTEAIQGCIDYAYQNGGMAVYFPSGAYLTQPLTLNEKVTLFGQDRYTTRIVMKGGATKPLFTGTIDEMSLTGLGFDGNMDIQVNNVNLFTITVNSAIITNCLLTDGYDLLNITVNNELQLDNILFRHAVENALVVGGGGYVQGDNLIFKSLSTLIGKNYVILNTNKSILEEVKCFGAAPNGVLIGGNSNVVNMWCEACQTPYVDNGTNNTVHVYSVMKDEKFTGNVSQYIGGHLTQTVVSKKILASGNLKDTANGTREESTTGNKTETVNGTKSVIVSRSLDENIGTNKISSVHGTKTETITGLYTENANGGKVLVSTDYNENVINKNITAAKIEETLTGNKTVTAANLTEIVAGDTTITSDDISATADNITFDVKTTLHTDAQNTDINSKEATTFTGKDFKVNTTEPLSYKTPTVLDRYFKSVPFKDELGEVYNVLVGSDFKSDIINVKDKGAKGDGVTDDTLAFQTAIKENVGNTILIPEGVYIISSINILSNTHIHGINRDGVILKQKAGSVSAMIKSLNVELDESSAAIRNFDLRNFTIDGNRQSGNNVSGLWIHGYGFNIDNLYVHDCGSNGMTFKGVDIAKSSWAKKPTISVVSNCHISYNGENGIKHGNIFDMTFDNCYVSSNSQSAQFKYANILSMSAAKFNNCHVWNQNDDEGTIRGGAAMDLQGNLYNINNCHIEGGYPYNLWIHGYGSIVSNCYIYNTFGDYSVLVEGNLTNIIGCILHGSAPDNVPYKKALLALIRVASVSNRLDYVANGPGVVGDFTSCDLSNITITYNTNTSQAPLVGKKDNNISTIRSNRQHMGIITYTENDNMWEKGYLAIGTDTTLPEPILSQECSIWNTGDKPITITVTGRSINYASNTTIPANTGIILKAVSTGNCVKIGG